MQTVLLAGNLVHEILPTSDVPLSDRYPAAFLEQCQQASDDVQVGWVLNKDGTFSEHAAPLAIPSRVVSSAEFLALFTAAQTAAVWSADPQLMVGALRVVAQGTANLDSPEAKALLDLAVAKNALTEADAARILAGTPPSTTAAS